MIVLGFLGEQISQTRSCGDLHRIELYVDGSDRCARLDLVGLGQS